MKKTCRRCHFPIPQAPGLCHVVWAVMMAIANTINIPAIAHYAPQEDDDSTQNSRSTEPTRHRWDGWNNDWDRRWRRNWGNSWAPRDNDVYVRHTYQTVVVPGSQPAQSQTKQWTSAVNPKSIPNFHEVHTFLFRGGQPTEDGLDLLHNMGVRTIVDLRCDPQQTESERQLCEHHDLKFVNIPLTLAKTAAPSNQDVSRFMDLIGGARENPDRGAVFVHDHLGADRVGCMVAMYRVLADKYPFNRAYGEMLQCGFHDNYSQMKQAVAKLDPNAKASVSSKPATNAAAHKAATHGASRTKVVRTKKTQAD